MPNWQPNWNNVNWNYGVANDAANELRRAANLLDETAVQRRRAADVALREWQGRYRDHFNHDLSEMLRRAQELAAQMRRKAQEIDNASIGARAEQNHRLQERQRWHHEKWQEEQVNNNP